VTAAIKTGRSRFAPSAEKLTSASKDIFQDHYDCRHEQQRRKQRAAPSRTFRQPSVLLESLEQRAKEHRPQRQEPRVLKDGPFVHRGSGPTDRFTTQGSTFVSRDGLVLSGRFRNPAWPPRQCKAQSGLCVPLRSPEASASVWSAQSFRQRRGHSRLHLASLRGRAQGMLEPSGM